MIIGHGTLGDVQADLVGLHLLALLCTSFSSHLGWELFHGLLTLRSIP